MEMEKLVWAEGSMARRLLAHRQVRDNSETQRETG